MNVLSSEDTEMNGSQGLKLLVRSGRLIQEESDQEKQEKLDIFKNLAVSIVGRMMLGHLSDPVS